MTDGEQESVTATLRRAMSWQSGAGPVGQFAIQSAVLLGAERVIAIDQCPYRLRLAREASGAETINYEEVDLNAGLKDMTGGRGPDACIDAVGMEAHVPGPLYAYDRAKQAIGLETDSPFALREPSWPVVAPPAAGRRVARVRHVPQQAR